MAALRQPPVVFQHADCAFGFLAAVGEQVPADLHARGIGYPPEGCSHEFRAGGLALGNIQAVAAKAGQRRHDFLEGAIWPRG